jgi:hypothetical protein
MNRTISLTGPEIFVGSLLTAIAEALVPVKTAPPVLVNLRKQVLHLESGNLCIEDLTETDKELLRDIWGELPGISPLTLLAQHNALRNLHADDFEPFFEAFKSSLNHPDWMLWPEYLDTTAVEEARRLEIRRKHSDQIEKWARSGRLRIFDCDDIEIENFAPDARISIDDARVYLSSFSPPFELKFEAETEQVRVHDAQTSFPTSGAPANTNIDTENASSLKHPGTTHRLANRTSVLSAEIEEAKRRVLDCTNVQSVWTELTKMAEHTIPYGCLVGYSSDGVQYRGKTYQLSQTPDVFTKKNLRDRMQRKKRCPKS